MNKPGIREVYLGLTSPNIMRKILWSNIWLILVPSKRQKHNAFMKCSFDFCCMKYVCFSFVKWCCISWFNSVFWIMLCCTPGHSTKSSKSGQFFVIKFYNSQISILVKVKKCNKIIIPLSSLCLPWVPLSSKPWCSDDLCCCSLGSFGNSCWICGCPPLQM